MRINQSSIKLNECLSWLVEGKGNGRGFAGNLGYDTVIVGGLCGNIVTILRGGFKEKKNVQNEKITVKI